MLMASISTQDTLRDTGIYTTVFHSFSTSIIHHVAPENTFLGKIVSSFFAPDAEILAAITVLGYFRSAS